MDTNEHEREKAAREINRRVGHELLDLMRLALITAAIVCTFAHDWHTTAGLLWAALSLTGLKELFL